jgi:hypothetical protein
VHPQQPVMKLWSRQICFAFVGNGTQPVQSLVASRHRLGYSDSPAYSRQKNKIAQKVKVITVTAFGGRKRVSSEVRTSSTYKTVKRFPQQVVVAHSCVSSEVRISSTHKK